MLVDRYPALVDGAFVIIAWIAAKLWVDYLHAAGVVDLEIPQWFSLALIGVIFAISFFYARMQGPIVIDETIHTLKERAEELIAEEGVAFGRDE